MTIEIYGPHVYVAEYKSNHHLTEEEYDQWFEDCLTSIALILQVNQDSIHVKLRQRKENRQSQYQKFGAAACEFEVAEGGLKFKVNLSDYLDTGLFLDHRMTRKLVMDQSEDKKVLNLFCYTGSFSVYAAAGGANEVVSVDLSNTYLAWAEENLLLNGFSNPIKYKNVRADVKQYLDDLPPDYFDIVVMDPPTFSNSKMMKDFLDIQRDHVELLNKVLKATKPGGLVYFSTNSRKFEINAEEIQANSIKDITKSTTPFDFEGKLLRWCFKIVK
jgi:23S rRNA (cytosine1962-C5)-methyltransferase